MARVNVTLIGLQRIGASFGLALKRHSQSQNAEHEFVITGSDESRDTMKAATALGAIDQEIRDPAEAVEKADIVVISMPYGIVKDILSIIGPVLKPGAVVIDFSPLKLPSIEWAKQHFPKGSDGKPVAYLIGVTPLINADYLQDARDGIEAAHADLFDHGSLAISPAATSPEEVVQLVADLADLLGLKVHFTDPAEYDALSATMESLPLLLQMALFRSLTSSPGWEDLQRLGNLAFTIGTYRLFTDKPEDVAALVEHNPQDIVRALETLMGSLREITDLVRNSSAETVGEAFGDASDRYKKWRVSRFTNKWKGEAQEDTSVQSGGGGFLGPLTGRFRLGGKKPDSDSRK